jgi:hypothetical protein
LAGQPDRLILSPFGTVISGQQDSEVWLPIGFQGGVHDLSGSGVVVMASGRPYDAHLGQWMTPAQSWMENVIKGFDDVNMLFAYRFR